MTERPLILVTNDDGIESPGLLAAVEAVYDLGDVLVVAPETQQTAAGRSFPPREITAKVHRLQLSDGATVEGRGLTATPAQVVRQALLIHAPRQPDLLVSGINYGENVGSSVTISGTIGAAIEGAAFGVPGLAASLETEIEHHLSHSDVVDFTAAGAFLRRFARTMLASHLPDGVDILKLDVPYNATPDTPWRITKVSRQRSIHSLIEELDGVKRLRGYYREFDVEALEPDSDAYAITVDEVVSVSPLTIDLTAHVDRATLAEALVTPCSASTGRAET